MLRIKHYLKCSLITEKKNIIKMPSRKPIIPGPFTGGSANSKNLLKALHSEMKDRNALVESSDEKSLATTSNDDVIEGPSGEDYATKLKEMRLKQKELEKSRTQIISESKTFEKSSSSESSEDEIDKRIK